MDIKEAIQHCRDVAGGCPAGDRDCAYQHDQLADWLEELVAYRAAMPLERVQELSQAEHDGLLLVLPCKRGQTVYFYVDGKMRKGDIYNIEVFSDGFVFHTKNNGYYACFSDSDIGESVFFCP